MKETEFVYRSYNFDVRAEEGETEAVITGRPVVYNSRADLGDFFEVIEAGALDKTDLTDVRFLVNHDTKMIPLARSRRNNGNSTMYLTVDALGLNLDWAKIDTRNSTAGRELVSAVKRGDITGMSFMFGIGGERWENLESEKPTRYITEITRIVEISAVTFPAYDQTEINARNKAALDSARKALENARNRDERTLDSGIEIYKEKIKILGGM